MTNNFNIYFAGSCSDLESKEYSRWRSQIKNEIKYGCSSDCYNINPVFFDLTEYYMLDNIENNINKEIFEFDLNALRKADLVIVNFVKPDSLGMNMELAIAYEHRIPVLGLNQHKLTLHPWLLECTNKIFDNMRELINYVVEFYLK